MSIVSAEKYRREFRLTATKLPLPILLVILALCVGLAIGKAPSDLIAEYNQGFGYALGEFALILLPAFILANALERAEAVISGKLSVAAAPLAGAGMVCPDTAYAAVSPIARGNRLAVAFGSYAGFKFLFPAGPLIVGAALSATNPSLFVLGIPMFFAAWLTGLAVARIFNREPKEEVPAHGQKIPSVAILPFATLFGLIGLGFLLRAIAVEPSYLAYLTDPKGALISAAVIAVVLSAAEDREALFQSSLRQTASLLFVIGAASALGHMLVEAITVERIVSLMDNPQIIVPMFFVVTALFKIIKGSSMAAFATIGGVAGGLVGSLPASPDAIVLAICAGSCALILPNDSFYWLVRRDALKHDTNAYATMILALGSGLQSIVAFGVLLFMMAAGLV